MSATSRTDRLIMIHLPFAFGAVHQWLNRVRQEQRAAGVQLLDPPAPRLRIPLDDERLFANTP